MEFKRFTFLLKDKGQSTVEYILLLAVVTLLANAVFQSDLFKSYFGEEGRFAKSYRAEIEFSYRHALRGREFFKPPNYNSRHKSYSWKGSKTRFFGAKVKYEGK